MLSGHTDVVPVDGQPWDTDPFEATLIGDRVFGRGVTDMKSFSRNRARVRAASSCAAGLRGRCISPSPTTRRSAASASGD